MNISRVNTLLCFSNDLRLHDNMAVYEANRQAKGLLCLYCIDPDWFKKDNLGLYAIGTHRWQFLQESLSALDVALRAVGQRLVVAYGKRTDVISDFLTRMPIQLVIRSHSVSYIENTQWQHLCYRHRNIRFQSVSTHTLFKQDQLPFEVAELPSAFSQFRKLVESTGSLYFTDTIELIPTPHSLAPCLMPNTSYKLLSKLNSTFTASAVHVSSVSSSSVSSPFIGGEKYALQHLQAYFQSEAPSRYKDTRNALETDDESWTLSSKFSLWLSNGCLSVKEVLHALQCYEQDYGANDSTYWIYLELLWREYYQWYALAYSYDLFAFREEGHPSILLKEDTPKFIQWCQAATPWPLVNACMGQLNQTGFLSNRGRQIVASSLVNELGIDWRCGAGYFEQQLVDYDEAANWGNWQCIAGLGADSNARRHFNIIKQQYIYDPHQKYVSRWMPKYPESDTSFPEHFIEMSDSVDEADSENEGINSVLMGHKVPELLN